MLIVVVIVVVLLTSESNIVAPGCKEMVRWGNTIHVSAQVQIEFLMEFS